jgi:NADP-dependent 3-hydroxy acid dehydrogenase YdfG
MSTPRSLQGSVVAITGAARGIGRATAAALVGAGARVAIGDLDDALARRAAADLGSAAVGLPLDVTDRAAFEAFYDAAERELGPVDVLINNAGIMQLGRFADEDEARTRRMVDINLLGVITGTQLALRRMRARDRGHIVNISSSAGKAGIPGGATYSATKFAVVGLSEAVRGELQREGSHIEISCVMPVAVNTELAAGLVDSRGVRPVEPEAVAAAILDALREPRFEVYVPRSLAAVYGLVAVLPRRGKDAVAHLVRADSALYDADPAARAAYEARAAASELPPDDDGDAPERSPASAV